MPTTSRRRGRGSTPIGDSVPLCVTSTISSPTNAPSRSATPSPMTIPPKASSPADTTSSRLPCVTASATSVTRASSSGSIPLMLTNTSPMRVRASALPWIAGAAAATPSTASSVRASAR